MNLVVLITLNYLFWFIVFVFQSLLIKRGVAIVKESEDEYEDNKIINGFFGFSLTPIALFFCFIISPVSSIILFFSLFGNFLISLNKPSKKRNPLIEEAEDEGLDLAEFVKKKEKLRK